MTEFIQLGLLGLCAGGLVSLSAQGLVLIYRGSGVLNLAHAAIGTLAMFVYWDLRDGRGWPFILACAAGVLASGACGLLTHYLVIRPLAKASVLARLIATLGVLVIIQSALALHYGSTQRVTSAVLPTSRWSIGDVEVGQDRVLLLLISVVVTAVLYVVYRWTKFGLATTATAENPRAAAALGLSPNAVAATNWVIGSALAGLAAVLMAPIVQVQLATQGALLATVLAASLLGGMRSFPLTFLGGALIGVTQAQVARYVDAPGWSQAVPFLFIMIVMIVRAKGLPVRPRVREAVPKVGSGRIQPGVVAGLLVAGFVLLQWGLAIRYVDATTLTFAVGLILLSSVVITGYTGQLSLCQFTMAGVGAVIAGLLVSKLDVSFEVALITAIGMSFPIGFVVGLPALRAHGVNLALLTVGLAAAAQAVLFSNTAYTGGDFVTVAPPRLFGLEVGAFLYPRRYAIMCMVIFVLLALVVANLRRGRSGRRLIAVRANDRAAAAIGVNVYGVKLYAFALSASIAAAGGILLVFRNTTLSYRSQFDVFSSINGILYAVFGGIGFVAGPVLGSLGQPAGPVAAVFHSQSDDFHRWLALIGGVAVILILQHYPDGAIRMMRDHAVHILRVLRILRHAPSEPREVLAANHIDEAPHSVPALTLETRTLTVRFGGVVALSDFNCTVRPGEVVGVIGPNGAGKTTMIEAISGFVVPRAGSVLLNDHPINGWSVHRRARAGLGRTFQSLELFDDMTVADNLRAAADRQDLASYATDLVWPRKTPLPDNAIAAVREFELEPDLDRLPSELSYGRRRLVAIARTVAARPSILCLDEPASGLSSTERTELAGLLRRLAGEWRMGIILVEHDVDLVMGASDRIVALEFGRTIAVGSPDEVRRDPAVIAAYLGHDGGEPAVEEPFDRDLVTKGAAE